MTPSDSDFENGDWQELAAQYWEDLTGSRDNARIPSVAEVAGALSEPYMRDALAEAGRRMLGLSLGGWRPGSDIGAYWPAGWPAGIYVPPDWLALAVNLSPSDFTSAHAMWLEGGEPAGMKHPLAPLIKAWQKRKLAEVEPDLSNRHAVAPMTAFRQPDKHRQATLIDLPDPAPFEHRDFEQAELPGWSASAPIPAVLALFDAAGANSLSKGRGAALQLRLFLELLMAVKPADRDQGRRVFSLTVREMKEWLWPNGWERGKHLPRLKEALRQVRDMTLPWQTTLRTGERITGAWFPIAIRGLAQSRIDSLDSEIEFDVYHPPGSAHGPLIDRIALRQTGVHSAPAYRAYLGLAYLWDKYLTGGGHRSGPTRPIVKRNEQGYILDGNGGMILERAGRPATNWNHPRAIRTGGDERNPAMDRLPMLSRNDLLKLCYPISTPTARAYLSKAREALKWLEGQNYVLLDQTSDGLRVLPPGWE